MISYRHCLLTWHRIAFILALNLTIHYFIYIFLGKELLNELNFYRNLLNIIWNAHKPTFAQIFKKKTISSVFYLYTQVLFENFIISFFVPLIRGNLTSILFPKQMVFLYHCIVILSYDFFFAIFSPVLCQYVSTQMYFW